MAYILKVNSRTDTDTDWASAMCDGCMFFQLYLRKLPTQKEFVALVDDLADGINPKRSIKEEWRQAARQCKAPRAQVGKRQEFNVPKGSNRYVTLLLEKIQWTEIPETTG